MQATDTSERVERIKQKAIGLGFDAFGIAPPEVSTAGEYLAEWLDKGMDGDMAWIRRGQQKRERPELVLPGIKSVICLGTNYHNAPRTLDFLNKPSLGEISSYALNSDYHDLITPRLKKLEAFLKEEFPDCTTRSYVDTGPVLEKALAERAGLGWIGKHTNLLNEKGSWFFLSEILIDVALPSSRSAENHCEECTSCIDICPTQAIVAPYVLDARRCISYLTIELKGVIPREFRKAIGNRIYGCDDCQIVCPWNAYATTTDEPAFKEREETRALIELMHMDDLQFRERFRKSPVKRIKRRGLLRNVAIALGNSSNPEAVPVLLDALKDPEPLIRAHSVWALGELMGDSAKQAVSDRLSDEKDPAVLQEMEFLNTH